ncbi:MAG: four helix bundle protein [bacterium]|nr:four helix bundle protein [bacterium]
MFDFEKLDVYRKAKLVSKDVIVLLRDIKGIDSYIRDQLKRASISSVINIAEGSGKFTKPDKRKFYIIARGSIYECVSLLELIHDDKLIDDALFDNFYKKHEELSKMLLGLISSQS